MFITNISQQSQQKNQQKHSNFHKQQFFNHYFKDYITNLYEIDDLSYLNSNSNSHSYQNQNIKHKNKYQSYHIDTSIYVNYVQNNKCNTSRQKDKLKNKNSKTKSNQKSKDKSNSSKPSLSPLPYKKYNHHLQQSYITNNNTKNHYVNKTFCTKNYQLFIINSTLKHFKRLLDLIKPYQQKSLNYSKSTKDIGFLKRYHVITQQLILFSFTPNRQFIQTKKFKNIIDGIYDDYQEFFVKKFKWYEYRRKGKNFQNLIEINRKINYNHGKDKQNYSNYKPLQKQQINCQSNNYQRLHLQQYIIYKLMTVYNDHINKNAQGKLQQILKFFYTLNYLKTTNKEIKIFAEFVEKDSFIGRVNQPLGNPQDLNNLNLQTSRNSHSHFHLNQTSNFDLFFGYVIIRKFSLIELKFISKHVLEQQQQSLQNKNQSSQNSCPYLTISSKTLFRVIRILQLRNSSDEKLEKLQQKSSFCESQYISPFSFNHFDSVNSGAQNKIIKGANSDNCNQKLQQVCKKKQYHLYQIFQELKKLNIQINQLKIEYLTKFIKKFQKFITNNQKKCSNLNEISQKYNDTLEDIIQTTIQDLIESLKNHFNCYPEYTMIHRILVNQALNKVLLVVDRLYQSYEKQIQNDKKQQQIQNNPSNSIKRVKQFSLKKLKQGFLQQAIQYLFKLFVKLFQRYRDQQQTVQLSSQVYLYETNSQKIEKIFDFQLKSKQKQKTMNNNLNLSSCCKSTQQNQFSQILRIYKSIINLYNYDILVVTKFSQRILTSNFFKNLVKKYSHY